MGQTVALASSGVLLLISDDVIQTTQCGIEKQGDTERSQMSCELSVKGQVTSQAVETDSITKREDPLARIISLQNVCTGKNQSNIGLRLVCHSATWPLVKIY